MSILQEAGGAAGNKELYCPGSGRVSSLPFSSLLASWHGRWGGGEKESARVFLSLAASLLPSISLFKFSLSGPLPVPPQWTPRTTPSSPPGLAPWHNRPIPAPHCCLLKASPSIRSGPSQTPLSPLAWPGPRCAELLGDLGSTGLSLTLCFRDSRFFSCLVLNTENVKVCLVLSS